MRQRQPFHAALRSQSVANGYRFLQLACGLALLVLVSGCNSFGNSRLVKELQTENERLLTEFRGQRDRASELEKANRLQAERLAESEKLLARMSQGAGTTGRLSSLPQAANPSVGEGGIPSGNMPVGASGGSLASPPTSAVPGDLRWQPRYDSRP